MSDERGDLTPEQLDELASAYLDGEATAEEAALVESDPRLQELVEELRAVRNLVGAPVEVPSDEVRDQMIARALDHRAPVVSMETARRRLRAIPPQARVILAAAAVVAAIAAVGVTIFERQGDEFADDDMASAPVVQADAPADAEDMPLPAAAAEPESMEANEESAASFDSDDADDVFTTEAPAEEMMDDEMAIELEEAPMDDGGYPEEEPLEAPAEDSDDGEAAMADEAADVAPTSGEELLVFETASDLADYMMLLAEDLVDAQGTSRLDESTAIDLMGCPLYPAEGIQLLSRFDAVVDEVEVQVSVYLSGDDLQVTETSPPPECELLNSHTFLNWLE